MEIDHYSPIMGRYHPVKHIDPVARRPAQGMLLNRSRRLDESLVTLERDTGGWSVHARVAPQNPYLTSRLGRAAQLSRDFLIHSRSTENVTCVCKFFIGLSTLVGIVVTPIYQGISLPGSRNLPGLHCRRCFRYLLLELGSSPGTDSSS